MLIFSLFTSLSWSQNVVMAVITIAGLFACVCILVVFGVVCLNWQTDVKLFIVSRTQLNKPFVTIEADEIPFDNYEKKDSSETLADNKKRSDSTTKNPTTAKTPEIHYKILQNLKLSAASKKSSSRNHYVQNV